MKSGIEKGDLVSVSFNGAQFTLCRRAIVKYIPSATGDSWVFEDSETGQIHYISEGITVSKKNKSKEGE